MEIQYLKDTYCWGFVLYIAALENGSLVGRVSLEFQNGREDSFISGLVVKENKRNQGIGSKLIDICGNVTLHNGREVIGLAIEADDERARDFYGKRGFSTVEELSWETEYGKYDTMRKRLDKTALKDWDLVATD